MSKLTGVRSVSIYSLAHFQYLHIFFPVFMESTETLHLLGESSKKIIYAVRYSPSPTARVA